MTQSRDTKRCCQYITYNKIELVCVCQKVAKSGKEALWKDGKVEFLCSLIDYFFAKHTYKTVHKAFVGVIIVAISCCVNISNSIQIKLIINLKIPITVSRQHTVTGLMMRCMNVLEIKLVSNWFTGKPIPNDVKVTCERGHCAGYKYVSETPSIVEDRETQQWPYV